MTAAAASPVSQKNSSPATRGPGWLFVIFATALSMSIGIFTGMLIDGSLEVVNAYRIDQRQRISLSRQPAKEARLIDTNTDSIETEPQLENEWYPENNAVEWGITMRPDQIPLGLTIHNESENLNRRILLQRRDRRSFTLAATIFVRAGEDATLRLPSGAYRVDVAASPDTMPWEIAQLQRAIPSYMIRLQNPDAGEDPQFAEIFIGDLGRVARSSTKTSDESPSEKPEDEQNTTPKTEDPQKSSIPEPTPSTEGMDGAEAEKHDSSTL